MSLEWRPPLEARGRSPELVLYFLPCAGPCGSVCPCVRRAFTVLRKVLTPLSYVLYQSSRNAAYLPNNKGKAYSNATHAQRSG